MQNYTRNTVYMGVPNVLKQAFHRARTISLGGRVIREGKVDMSIPRYDSNKYQYENGRIINVLKEK